MSFGLYHLDGWHEIRYEGRNAERRFHCASSVFLLLAISIMYMYIMVLELVDWNFVFCFGLRLFWNFAQVVPHLVSHTFFWTPSRECVNLFHIRAKLLLHTSVLRPSLSWPSSVTFVTFLCRITAHPFPRPVSLVPLCQFRPVVVIPLVRSCAPFCDLYSLLVRFRSPLLYTVSLPVSSFPSSF